jgi:hypothetical protein
MSVMVVGSGCGNRSDTGAANAFVDAYECWEEVEKGLKVLALGFPLLITVTFFKGSNQ